MRSEPDVELDDRTEDLLRKTLDWQAGTAPLGTDLLRELRQARPRWRPVPGRRWTALLLPACVVVAVALAAIGIPVALHQGGPGQAGPADGQWPVGTASMPYHPTWVPAGFGEVARSVSPVDYPGGETWWEPNGQHHWSKVDQGDQQLSFGVVWESGGNASRTATDLPNSEPITINGSPGSITLDSLPGGQYAAAVINWAVSDHFWLSVGVQSVPDPSTVAKHMAESVVAGGPDTDAPVTLPVGVTAYGELSGFMVESSSPADFTVTYLFKGSPPSEVLLSTLPPVPDPATAPGRQPVIVQGQSGWYLPGTIKGVDVLSTIAVHLGRWWVEFSYGVGDIGQLTKMANSIHINQAATYSWIGKP